MADYNYANDGKIHTRYSELIRCTPGQIDRVVAERLDGRRRAETADMADGTVRHLMWQEEAEKTRRVPEIFGVDWPVSHVEQEFATEVLPGIVVHSRVDILCKTQQLIPDFKTVVDGKQGWKKIVDGYRQSAKQRQLKFYAFQAGMHGIHINKGAFLCEVWNRQRDTILRYEIVPFKISPLDIAEAVNWIKPRAALLATVLEERLA